jgi:hypothetical protein
MSVMRSVADGGEPEEVVEAQPAIYLSRVSLRYGGGVDGRGSNSFATEITFGRSAAGIPDILEPKELIPNYRFICLDKHYDEPDALPPASGFSHREPPGSSRKRG